MDLERLDASLHAVPDGAAASPSLDAYAAPTVGTRRCFPLKATHPPGSRGARWPGRPASREMTDGDRSCTCRNDPLPRPDPGLEPASRQTTGTTMPAARQIRPDRQWHQPRSAALSAHTAPPRLIQPSLHLRQLVERAVQVQRSLLPDISGPIGEFRVASLYVPCDEVGGDFYDLAMRRDCALLLVSDVMGHGVGAAFMTMLVKAAFQETAVGTGDPAEVLAGMNGRLHRIMPPGMFVAAAVATLALDGTDMQLANAGLPHPFVLRGAAGRVDELGVDGIPLGLFDRLGPDSCDATRVSLAPGDVLLVASDGIGSIEGLGGQCFGECHLREALGGLTGRDGKEVLDRLLGEAVGFGGGRPNPDDIDLIAVSRQAPAAPPAAVG
jgi:serine phosphatase RsbU (regulator of sigma subunit)